MIFRIGAISLNQKDKTQCDQYLPTTAVLKTSKKLDIV